MFLEQIKVTEKKVIYSFQEIWPGDCAHGSSVSSECIIMEYFYHANPRHAGIINFITSLAFPC